MENQLEKLLGQFVFLQTDCKQTQQDWCAAMAAAQVSALPRLLVSFNRKMQNPGHRLQLNVTDINVTDTQKHTPPFVLSEVAIISFKRR